VDLDKAFVAVVLREGATGWRKAVEKGIVPALLSGDGLLAYEYAIDYHKTYGDFPTTDIVQARLSIDLGAANGSVEYFSDEIRNRKMHGDIQSGVSKVIAALRQDPKTAMIELEKVLSGLRKERLGTSRVRPLSSLADEVWAYYQRVKAGETGILTPWPSMNDPTLGFWPEDLIVVMARQGVGKTWFAIIIALYAWSKHKRVLVATTEIAQVSLGIRFLTLYNKVAYSEFRRGRLSIFAEEKYQKGIEDLKQLEDLWVMGGDFDMRPESLEAAIEETSPDLVIVDGAYLLSTEGNSRTEKAAEVFNELKRIANRSKASVLATTQLNRSAKTESPNSIRLENAGLTDVVGWNADIAIGLAQTEDMRSDKQMLVKFLKLREGFGKDFTVQWDLDLMSFIELVATGPEADEFGTGIGATGTTDASANTDGETLF
jgi:replicative DNA helicase